MKSTSTDPAREFNNQLRKTPVAIIGLASIFPKATDVQEYWDNILHKIDCLTEVPESRWSVADYYDPDPSAPDKSYNKRGGFLPDIDFDPTEFGLPPNLLEATDVSQLLGLVVARDALEDAGYGEGREWNRSSTGVILGVVGVSMKSYVPLMARLQYPVWEKVLRASGVSAADTAKIIEKIKLAYAGWEENSFPGSLANVVAGRIANRFDLGGTNCIIDAACGTSLAAIRMALMELVEHRADMMITGGVDTDNSIGVYLSFSKTPAFSKGEAVRTFDADSDGMMAGEGIGMVVLKRLEDAERDGDRIYAVIRGSGSSSDGRYKSIYAPRPSGQAEALRRAYREAGYAPASVGLIEAHGTGTPAGDPAEFAGLREVFEAGNPERQYIALGSVKSQIAHTKGAAGVAGLIKIALALHHKILPPTINVKKPNPKLDVENSPFYINTEVRPWFRHDPQTPRRAGVSAFGFGGTNFHTTLEEYQAEHTAPYRVHSVPQAVLLSAAGPAELAKACQAALAKLQGAGGSGSLNELARESQTGAPPQGHARVGFVAESAHEAAELLQAAIEYIQQKPDAEAWEHPKGIYYRKAGLETQGKVVALFSGQGSQYLEMGRELACNFPPIRQAFAEMDELFVKDGLKPLSSRVYPPPVFDQARRDALSDVLTRTEHAQPAIGSLSVGLYRLLRQAGFAPDFAAGHSFGELTALWAAGVLEDRDYCFLAKSRGKAMAAPEDPTFDSGTMLAVKGDALQVKEAIAQFPEITLANWNSPTQVVLAGSRAAVAAVQAHLTGLGYSVVQLPVSAAFHTPLVGHAQKPFAEAIDQVKFNAPKVRLYSNTTGKAHSSDPEEIRAALKGHILNPVLFKDEIENIYAAGGRIFVEFGPKNVLTNLVKSILEDRPHLAVALNATPKKDSDRLLREAAVQLRVAGLPLGDVDPYQAPARKPPARKKSLATVKLNGGLYVSPKTKAGFEKALADGFRIAQAQPAGPAAAPAPAPAAQALPAAQAAPPASAPAAQALGESLARLAGHQGEVLRLHEQYQRNQEEYGKIFARLTEQQIALLSGAPAEKLAQIGPVFESLERSMQRFHDLQAETLRIHAEYLQSQEEYARSLAALAHQQAGALQGGQIGFQQAAPPPQPAPKAGLSAPAPAASNGNGHRQAAAAEEPAPAPVPAQAPAAVYDAETLTQALLAVVSEKTGYPVEMLELDSDMEADLGIDSIKRVEIMGALREQFPNLPPADPEAFAEVRTLGQTVRYMTSRSAATNAAAAPQPALPATALKPAAQPAAGAALDSTALTQALLEVVSEKTGYPAEMLELTADMEADLGIDSIKRVEIMGALRERFPGLPPADPEAFAEVRTLGQTVEYITSRRAAPIQAAATPEQPAHAPVPAPAQEAAPESAAGGYGVEVLTRALLEVVSEKTGYPVEMLELGADMEADLGIDSIKRVEIMGALRAQYPALPQADPEAFAEVRTLGDVVAYLAAREAPRPEPAPEHEDANGRNGASYAGIPRGVVGLKPLPQPDFSEYHLPEGRVCLLSDDGTPTAAALARKLTGRGWKVVALGFPEGLAPNRADLPEGVARVALADMSEEHLRQTLAAIAREHGPVGAFIHLNPPAGQSDGLFSEAQKEIVRHVFLLAKHLKEPLTQAPAGGHAAFVVVVRMDGEFGLGSQVDFDPVAGGLFGLAKTLNLEWESVFCRAIDLSPQIEAEQAARYIIAELFDPSRLVTEVGYSPNGRATLVVEQVLAGGVN